MESLSIIIPHLGVSMGMCLCVRYKFNTGPNTIAMHKNLNHITDCVLTTAEIPRTIRNSLCRTRLILYRYPLWLICCYYSEPHYVFIVHSLYHSVKMLIEHFYDVYNMDKERHEKCFDLLLNFHDVDGVMLQVLCYSHW